jgi:hypothetical protein
MSQLVSEYYGCNTSRTVIFLKIAVRIRLDVHIRTIVVLTSGKLTEIFFAITLCNLLFCNDAPMKR